MRERFRAFIRILFAGLVAFFATGAATANAGDLAVTVRDANGKPVADAVVTAVLKSGAPLPPQQSNGVYRVNQKDTAYDPFVSIVPAGTPVAFKNSDSWGHHVYSFSKAKRFDITVPAQKSSDPLLFDKPGVVVIGCNIHDRMLAYIYVSGNGMPSKSNKMGVARFLGLPPGAYRLTAWHPLLRSKRKQPTADITVQQDSEAAMDLVATLKQPNKKKRKPYKY